MNLNRRRFIQSATALFCAPAIVHAENIMRISAPEFVTVAALPADMSMAELASASAVPFKLAGLAKGDRVTVFDATTMEILINEKEKHGRVEHKMLYTRDRDVTIDVVNDGSKGLSFPPLHFDTRIDAQGLDIRTIRVTDATWKVYSNAKSVILPSHDMGDYR